MAHIVIPVGGAALPTAGLTAEVGDVLSGKTFISNAGTEETGTYTLAAATATGDAIAAEINVGKKAWVDGVEVTGTRPPDYWQYVRDMSSAFYGGTELTGDVTIHAPLNVRLYNTFRGQTGMTSLTFTFGVLTMISNAFLGCTGLVSLNGTLDLTNCASAGDLDTALNSCTSLTTISILANSLRMSWNINQASALNAASLVSLANAMYEGAAGTLTLHATAKTVWNEIRGTISGSSGAWVFTDDAGTDTLATFIDADHKNWTVA